MADAFGAREAFRAGVVPADLVDRCPWFEDDVAAVSQRGPRIGVAGPDIVRDARGELLVLEDNVRTPTLMAFAMAARPLVAAALPDAPHPHSFQAALRDALHAMAGDGRTVILGREPDNIVWWELEQLARLTGWPLVGIGDLAERDGRVVLRRRRLAGRRRVAAHERGPPAPRRRAPHRARRGPARAAAARRGAGRQRLRDRRRRRQAHVRLRRPARALLLRRRAAAALRARLGPRRRRPARGSARAARRARRQAARWRRRRGDRARPAGVGRRARRAARPHRRRPERLDRPGAGRAVDAPHGRRRPASRRATSTCARSSSAAACCPAA